MLVNSKKAEVNYKESYSMLVPDIEDDYYQ